MPLIFNLAQIALGPCPTFDCHLLVNYKMRNLTFWRSVYAMLVNADQICRLISNNNCRNFFSQSPRLWSIVQETDCLLVITVTIVTTVTDIKTVTAFFMTVCLIV